MCWSISGPFWAGILELQVQSRFLLTGVGGHLRQQVSHAAKQPLTLVSPGGRSLGGLSELGSADSVLVRPLP